MRALDQSTRVTGRAQLEAQKIIDEAMEEADEKLVEYIAEVMEKAQQTTAELIGKAKREANEKSATIISKSKEVASRIIDDAELRAKNEAMRRTNRAVEHIISEAKEEAIRIVAKASQIAEKRAGQIITDSRREKARADLFEITPEAEPGTSRLAKKAIDKAKKVTEQSARVIAGVKQKAKGACQGS